MDCKNRIIKLRESTGLNRKDFCKLVHIPYRTMTEWELDNRHAPDYVLWLLEYYIRNEGLVVKEMNEGKADWQIITYANSKHTFTNPETADYNPIMAKRAWNHTLLFLKEILK